MKLIVVVFVGILFSVATLEVDVFDYDNTFLDYYDSYIKVDTKATQKILTVDFNRFASSDIILLVYVPSPQKIVFSQAESNSSNYFYRPKLFLKLSSLLI